MICNKKQLLIVSLLLFNFVLLINANNNSALAINNFNSNNAINRDSLAETYDDFRVDTTLTEMNRWETSGIDLEVNHDPINSKLTFNGDYHQPINFTDFISFDDQFNNDNLTENVWTQYKDAQSDCEEPSTVGGSCFTEENGFLTLGSTDPVTDQASFYVNFINENIDDNITLPYRFDTDIRLDLVEDDNSGDVAFKINLGTNETYDDTYFFIRAERYDYGIDERWYLALGYVYDGNDVYNYFSGNYVPAFSPDETGTVFQSLPVLNASVKLIVTEDRTLWYIDDSLVSNVSTHANFKDVENKICSIGINKEIVNDYDDNGYILVNYVTVYNLEGDITTENRYANLEREIENSGIINSQMQFNNYTYVNSSIIFEHGVKLDGNKTAYFKIENRSISIINNGIRVNQTSVLPLYTTIYFEIEYNLDDIKFSIFAYNKTYIYSTIANTLDLNKLEVFYYVYQEYAYDKVNIDLYNVKAPFKSAESYRITEHSIVDVTRETEEYMRFDGNDSTYNVIRYTNYVQDFRAYSGLLKIFTERNHGDLSLYVELSPINSSGLADSSEFGITPTNDYSIRVGLWSWWTSTTSGFQTGVIEDNEVGSIVASQQITDCLAMELGFYAWMKENSEVQIAMRYQELVDQSSSEKFADKVDKYNMDSWELFNALRWMKVDLYYYYSGNDPDFGGEMGISVVKFDRGEPIDEPLLPTPNTPIIYDPPTNLIDWLVGGIVGAIFSFLGIFVPIFAFFGELPNMIVNGFIDLLTWLWNFIVPLLADGYSQFCNWLFKTFPIIENIWEFIADLLEFSVDFIIEITPFLPELFDFTIWLIQTIYDIIFPYIEYWINFLLTDTNKAMLYIFIWLNIFALIPFFIEYIIRIDDIDRGKITEEEIFMKNFGFYVGFWKFVYSLIVGLINFAFRIVELIISAIAGVIP